MKFCRYILLFVTLGLLCTGCTSDEPAAPRAEGDCELIVTLDTGSPLTRAAEDNPWSDPYPEEPGNQMENAVESLSLYFVTEDGKTIAPLTPTADGQKEGRYVFRTTVNVNDSYVRDHGNGVYSLSGRIVAVANYPDEPPVNPFGDLLFDMNRMHSAGRIPMWGVMTVSELPLRVNQTTHAGDVKLLRAVPKLSVKLAGDIAGLYRITDIRPDDSAYPKYNHCEPSGALAAASTGNLLIDGCFNPAPPSPTESLSFHGKGSDAIWCYLPERSFQATGGKPVSFTVTLERRDGTGAPFTGKVYMCDYDKKGKPLFDTAFPSLVRNHEYRYIISLSELKFEIEFQHWIFGGKVNLEFE